MSHPIDPLVEAAARYDSLFVPALFGEWAPRVAGAAGIRAGQRALDIACGTGVLAREVRWRVGSEGSVTGLDLNPGMLAVAKERAPGIHWVRARAEAMPLRSGWFDAALSQFGLMFFSDRAGAIREMMRVVRPGGRVAVAVWDALERIPAYRGFVEVVQRIGGNDAGDALRAPFSLGERAQLEALFAQCGAVKAGSATVAGEARFPRATAMVEADLRGWLPAMGVTLSEGQIARILEEAVQELSSYVGSTRRLVFEMRAHIVTGVAA